jgi:hypothetical protein
VRNATARHAFVPLASFRFRFAIYNPHFLFSGYWSRFIAFLPVTRRPVLKRAKQGVAECRSSDVGPHYSVRVGVRPVIVRGDGLWKRIPLGLRLNVDGGTGRGKKWGVGCGTV